MGHHGRLVRQDLATRGVLDVMSRSCGLSSGLSVRASRGPGEPHEVLSGSKQRCRPGSMTDTGFEHRRDVNGTSQGERSVRSPHTGGMGHASPRAAVVDAVDAVAGTPARVAVLEP
jgi:hypothetical protein